MKYTGKRLLSALLALAVLLTLLPGLPRKAEAGGVIPGELATVDAGQEMTLVVQGEYSDKTVTNLVFESVGGTIATITRYKPTGEQEWERAICDDDFQEFAYNCTIGDRFEIKVRYGQIRVLFDLANHGEDPTCTYFEFGEKLDWLVKPTINEVYMKVGDTATLNVSQVADGFSARANSYDGYDRVAMVGDDGTITARAPGTTTVYMEVLFWQTSYQYFCFWLPCTVHVIEDYTVDAYWDSYYMEPEEKYFNIVAYRPDGMRDVGFTITVGEESYSTNNRTNAVVPVPADYTGSITVTKAGYLPYELKAEYLEASNVITMTPAAETGPVIRSVWMRSGDSGSRNTKYQTIQVIEGKETEFEIFCDIVWNGHGAGNVYLQQDLVTLPLREEQTTVALGQYFKADGGQIFLHALTTDGHVVKVPLLVNVAAPVTTMEMNFGESVSTTVDQSVTGLGGQAVGFDLLSTVPVKFELGADGSVRGLIGLKFSGPASENPDLYEIQNEIREIVKQMEAAESSGDKKLTGSLKAKLDRVLKEEKAYLEDRKVGFGFDSDASFLGYFDGVMNDGSLEITEVGMIAIFNVSAAGSGDFFIGKVPAEWKLKFTDELELLICGLAGGSDGKLNFLVPAFTNKISVTGAVRTGYLDAIGASIALQGNFTFDYPREAKSFADGTWSVDANFKVTGDIAGSDFDLLKLDSVEGFSIWPEAALSSYSLGDTQTPASYGFVPNIQDTVEQAYERAQAIRSDISKDSVPQLVRLADMDVLVWTEKLSGRPEADGDCLCYAVRSHESDTWGDPFRVYDTGTRDAVPQLVQVGEELYVIWQKTSGSLAEVTERGDILQRTDICVARFDTATGKFLEGTLIHESDDRMDLMPQLQQVNGRLEAAWIRIDGDPLDPDSTASILRAAYSEESGWSSLPALDLPGIPTGLALGEDGTLYYTLNGRLYRVSDGTATPMTPEDADARAPKFCQGKLYWLEDACVTDGTERIPASIEAGDFGLFISPDGSKKALVFYDSDEAGSRHFVTYGSDAGWGESREVTPAEANARASGLTGYIDNDGKLVMAVNRLRTFSSGNQLSYLRLYTTPSRLDLEITDLEYLGTSMQSDNWLLTNVCVTNLGNLPVDAVYLQVMDGETSLQDLCVQLDLQAGGSAGVELLIPVELAARQGITVLALPADGTDADLTDNSAALEVNPGDISSEYMTLDTLPDGTVQLAAMLINRGMTDLTGIHVVFTKGTSDGEVLDTLEVAGAAVGEVIPVNVDLSGLAEGDLVYMTASLEGEENYISNNTAFARVCPVIRETGVVSSGEDFQGRQLELDTDYSFVTDRDDETGEGRIFTGMFTPEETGFYLIRLEGKNSSSTWARNIECRVSCEDGTSVELELVSEEESDQTGTGWMRREVHIACLEAGVDYSVQATGAINTVMTVRLEKAPAVTEIRTRDHTMYLGEDRLWQHGDMYHLGLVTLLPELSRDHLTFHSSNEAVATVDENGQITTFAIGTTVITVSGQISGAEGNFTLTVVEPDYAEPLSLGGNTVTVEQENTHTVRIFTAPETGYYQFASAGNRSGYVLVDGEFRQITGALLLRAGEEYPCYFEYSDTWTIRKVAARGDVHLEENKSCDGTDCENVLLYRHVPREDYLLSAWFSGTTCALKIYDADFRLLYSASRDSDWYGSERLSGLMEKGKTYYVALEHLGEAEFSLNPVTMELYYLGPVFVGDVLELSPRFPDTGYEEDYTYTWSSSNPSVATVDQNGVIRFLKEGEVTISVTTMDGLIRGEKTFYAIAEDILRLDQECRNTLDNQLINGARFVFTPETAGDYLFKLRYNVTGDVYWMYEYILTDREENYLDSIHDESLSGLGSNSSIHLEAGQTCVLTFFFEAEKTGTLRFDLAAVVTRLNCGAEGHSYVEGYSWEPTCEEPGMTADRHCQYCGYVLVPQEEIPALGHSYGKPVFTWSEDNTVSAAVICANDETHVVELDASVTSETKKAANCKTRDITTYTATAQYEGKVYTDTKIVEGALGGHADGDNNGKCDSCGKNLGKPENPEKPEKPEKPVIEDVTRLAGANRWETSLKVAGEMKANLGLEKFDSIIIASGNDFADALAGSYLSTVKNAPILLGWGKGGKYVTLDEANIAYIKANLAEGGTVYILGGKNAVPELYETELKGYNVKRLGGANRFETNLLILEEAGVAEGSEILVCTSTNFADSLSASATAKPILLVFNEYGKLYGKQPEFLAGLKNCTFTVIGGESAVSAKLFDAIKAYGTTTRLAGANRFETSVLVAEKYFENPETAVLAYAWNYPDGLCGGSLAYSLKAPLILTMTKYEAKAVEYMTKAGIEIGLVLGGDTLISDDAVRAIFAMEKADDIVKK